MRPVNPRKSKTFSFLLGLVYGYRTADIDLKMYTLEEFESFETEGFDIYYLNKHEDIVTKNEPIDNPTHIVAIMEDKENKKVIIRIFKRK